MPTYTDLQKAQFRQIMGFSKFFSSANSVFENVLNEIETVLDDGSTFNLTISLLNNILTIDQLRTANQPLGFATAADDVKFDAVRNDRFLKSQGRTYIQQLSAIFCIKPVADYYGRASLDASGDVFLFGERQHDY